MFDKIVAHWGKDAADVYALYLAGYKCGLGTAYIRKNFPELYSAPGREKYKDRIEDELRKAGYLPPIPFQFDMFSELLPPAQYRNYWNQHYAREARRPTEPVYEVIE